MKVSQIVKCVFILLVLQANINIAKAQKNNSALLVIDLQQNFLDSESKLHIDTTHLNVFLANVNQAIEHMHNKGGTVFYVVNEWVSPIKNMVTGNVCKKGAEGVGIDSRIKRITPEVYTKSKGNALSNVDLLMDLKANKINDVYVVGLFAEGCVKATVKGLLQEEFNPIVIEDALGSKNEEKRMKIVEAFKEDGVKVIRVKEL